MPKQELIQWFRSEKQKSNSVLRIPDEIFEMLDIDTARQIVKEIGEDTLLYLPKHEIQFFEWLKSADGNVWNDLWAGVSEEPYVVSISFLPLLIDRFRGFPICDLMANDNYYFTQEFIVWKTAQLILDGIRERFLRRESLTIAQQLLLEISIHPIDIWHFAYHYRFKLEDVKSAVNELVEDNLLVHFKKAEELADFIQF